MHNRKPAMDSDRVLDTDLATYLHTLAARLRGVALAISAPVLRDGATGDAEAAALLELAAAQERIAHALDRAADRLCDRCQLTGVTETVTVGAPPPSRPYRIRSGARTIKERVSPAWERTDALA